MSAVEIKKDIHWVGVRNPELRVFDIIMTTKKGTTYNSYLIVDEKVVLIDTVKEGYLDEYLEKIRSIIGDRPIDYVVVNHTEPDHSGSIKGILDVYKDAVVYGSRAALNNIRQIINREFNGVEAKEDLNIGKRTLKFISAPLLHWPDTIFTYSEYDNVIFTGDVFGCHYCDEEGKVFNDQVGDFADEFKYYYDVIMGPFKKNVLQAIEKIRPLTNLEVICTSHGPVLRKNIWEYVDIYENWSKVVLEAQKSRRAIIAYVTSYGYTREAAEAIAAGVREAGSEAEIYDISESNIAELIARVEESKALIVGSPTINQDAVKPVWDFLSEVSPVVNRGKIAASFGSYGWSGESVPLITDRLKGLKFKVIEPGLKIHFRASDSEIEACRELGRQVGNLI